MKVINFAIIKDERHRFSADEKFADHEEMGCSDFMDKHYDLINNYPVNQEEGKFPHIQVFEISNHFEKTLPPFVVLFNTLYTNQTVTLYNVVDLYGLISLFLPIVAHEEHRLNMIRTNKEFFEITKSNNELLRNIQQDE